MTFSTKDILGLGTILGIWAHPDDESWCSAGIMAQAVQNGQHIICVTATRGEGGKTANESRWPQTQLGEIRTAELEAALKILGAPEHYWLDYQDGQLNDVDKNEAVGQLTELINKIQPDSIFTFGPDGLTGHPDHISTYEWTKQAICKSGSKAKHFVVREKKQRYDNVPAEFHDLIYFNIDTPDLVLRENADLFYSLPPEILELKMSVLKAQPSQMNVFFDRPGGEEFLRNYMANECFSLASDE